MYIMGFIHSKALQRFENRSQMKMEICKNVPFNVYELALVDLLGYYEPFHACTCIQRGPG